MPPKPPPLTLDPGRLDVLARVADAKTAAMAGLRDRRHDLRAALNDATLRHTRRLEQDADVQPTRHFERHAIEGEADRLGREVADRQREISDLDADLAAASRDLGQARRTYLSALTLACAEGMPLSTNHLEAARAARINTAASELATFSAEVLQ